MLQKTVLLLLLLLTSCTAARMNSSLDPVKTGQPHLKAVVDRNAAVGFSGVVLVAQGADVLLLDGFGPSGSAPVARTSRFWIASTGKQFTSAGILKLVDQGKLRLDDQLAHFFTRAPAEKAAISVRQLLSHTSGLGQSYVSEAQSNRDVAVDRMLAEPLQGSPGSGFRYSNSNIQLAAAIIEVVSGMSFGDFTRRHLWRSAGLVSTGFAGDDGASGVYPIAGELPPRLRQAYWGEQGVYSSAGDLFRWYRALKAGRILRPESVQTLFEPVVKIGEGQAALGWFTGVSPAGQRMIFTRGNEDFGANSLIYAYPNQDVLIIILTHAGTADGDLSWSRKLHRELEAELQL